LLRPELIKLLRDDAEVLQGLVPHLGQTLLLLSKAGTFSPDFMVSTYVCMIISEYKICFLLVQSIEVSVNKFHHCNVKIGISFRLTEFYPCQSSYSC
jgi:hypothetical protein